MSLLLSDLILQKLTNRDLIPSRLILSFEFPFRPIQRFTVDSAIYV